MLCSFNKPGILIKMTRLRKIGWADFLKKMSKPLRCTEQCSLTNQVHDCTVKHVYNEVTGTGDIAP